MRNLTYEMFEEMIYAVEEDIKTTMKLSDITMGKLELGELYSGADNLVSLLMFLLEDHDGLIWDGLLIKDVILQSDIKKVWNELNNRQS